MKAVQITEFGGPEVMKYVDIDDPTPNSGEAVVEIQAAGVNFTDVRVPASNLIGGVENGGWMNAMKAFDHSRPAVAAAAVGNARGAMEEAWRYAKERKTFGKANSQHQSKSFILADMATKIEAATHQTLSHIQI